MVQRFSFQLNRRLSALTRRRVGLSLQDGELWAGEMLRPAGFSAGRGACARGGTAGDFGIGGGAVCRRSRRGLRFYCGVLPSVHACLFSFVRKKETACDILRFYSAGSRSPFVRSRSALRLSALAGSLRACAFIYGDPDGLPENGERGWRRGFCALLRRRIGLDMLSAGSTLGLRAPNLRQRVFDSLDSLHWVRGKVRLCKTSQ